MAVPLPVLKIAVRRRALGAIIVGSLALHAAFLLLGRTALVDWRWVHEPLHAVAEAAGAFIALAIVPLLASLGKRGDGTSHNNVIASAMAGLGVLDGLHAIVHVGDVFVWLHSLATFVAGVVFSLVWLPKRITNHVTPIRVLVIAGLVGALSIALPAWLPPMVVAGRFTPAALSLNVAGGVLLLLSAVRLVISWRQTGNDDDLLFVVHCALFGAAAIMFEQSSLWDVPWWGWHLLRLCAYGVALYYVVASLRIEEELARRSTALQQANEELEHFTFAASHDLKEPLRAVTSYGAALSAGYSDRLDERGVRWLGYMVDGAQQLQRLISDLLEYARLEAGAGPFQPVPLEAVVSDTRERLASSIQARDAQIIVEGSLPTVLGDRVQLTQLLQNLVSNAIKFCRKPPRVRIACQPGDSGYVLSVTDNGIGIPELHRDRAFQVFKRLVPRDEFPGTGVGLAICKRVVEQHGGAIWIDDGAGGVGTTFNVSLPDQAARAGGSGE